MVKDTWLEASALCPKKTRRDISMEEQEEQPQEKEHVMEHNTPFPILFLLMHLGFQACIIVGMIVSNTHNTHARNRMITAISRILPSQSPIIKGLSMEISIKEGTSNLPTCRVVGAVQEDAASRQE